MVKEGEWRHTRSAISLVCAITVLCCRARAFLARSSLSCSPLVNSACSTTTAAVYASSSTMTNQSLMPSEERGAKKKRRRRSRGVMKEQTQYT